LPPLNAVGGAGNRKRGETIDAAGMKGVEEDIFQEQKQSISLSYQLDTITKDRKDEFLTAIAPVRECVNVIDLMLSRIRIDMLYV